MIFERISVMVVATIPLTLVFVWLWRRYLRLDHANKKLEMQVADLSRQLEYSNGLKQKITMMIAHDLQSPLHFLNVLSDHVLRFAANNQLTEVKAGTEEIRKATANIHAFVKEINLWARSQHDNFELAQHVFPFSELVAELRQFFAEMLLINQNKLTVRYPDDVAIFANRDILKAILRNLIDNANKHTCHGEIVLAFASAPNGKATLTVSDNGSGMAPADLQRIRRRISNPAGDGQVEPSSRMGYQIIVDFAHTLGYSLDVASTRGEGTTVVVSGLVCSEPFTPRVQSADVVGICELD